MTTRACVVPLLVVLFLVACGGGTPTATLPPTISVPPTATPRPGPPAHGLNELVRIANWEMAVAKVERPGPQLVWSQSGNASTAQGTWLAIAFDLKNIAAQPLAVTAPDFVLSDPEGAIVKTTTDIGGYNYSAFKGGQIVGGAIPPGVTVRYYLVYDVPIAATGLQLVFNQDTKPRFAVGNARQ